MWRLKRTRDSSAMLSQPGSPAYLRQRRAAFEQERSAAQSRSSPRPERWYRGKRLRPTAPLFLDQRGDVDNRPRFRGCRRTCHQSAPDANEARAGGHTLETNASVVLDDLQLGPGCHSGAFANGGWNDDSACLVDGSSHAIILPSECAPAAGSTLPNRELGTLELEPRPGTLNVER